jgi:hypothetical protein
MGKFSDLDIDRRNRIRHIEAQFCFKDMMTGECYVVPFMLTPDGGAFLYPWGFQEIPFGTPTPDPFPEDAARQLCEAAIASALNRPPSVDVDFDE